MHPAEKIRRRCEICTESDCRTPASHLPGSQVNECEACGPAPNDDESVSVPAKRAFFFVATSFAASHRRSGAGRMVIFSEIVQSRRETLQLGTGRTNEYADWQDTISPATLAGAQHQRILS